jgi:probable HAF family extracellular repeat protein
MVRLGDLAGGAFRSEAYGVSSLGNVIVGASSSSNSGASSVEAFRLAAGGTMVGLGDFPGGTFLSEARAASFDGSVIVGTGTRDAGPEAFRWTSGSGMVGLGDLPGGNFSSYAHSVSASGNAVVGWSGSSVSPQGEAFLWTPQGGMQRLFEVLVNNGATGLTGWLLSEATGISANGQWIVGTGRNPSGSQEAFIANITPSPVPVLPAVWLLGSALGVLGWLRRRTAL